MEPYKFGWFPEGGEERPYEYPDVWSVEKTTGPDRLVIAPRVGHIHLLLELAGQLGEPILLLYVLMVARGGGEAGRYQSEDSLNLREVEVFLHKYQGLLEKDGRNSIWIHSHRGTLVYDRHNVIYAYGPLDDFETVLRAGSLTKAQNVFFPDPHAHHYNFQFDHAETSILHALSWIHSPLRPGDYNPESNNPASTHPG